MMRNDTVNFRNYAAQVFLGNIALAPLAFYRLGADLRRRTSSTGTGKEND
jgi:hypothetical protein